MSQNNKYFKIVEKVQEYTEKHPEASYDDIRKYVKMVMFTQQFHHHQDVLINQMIIDGYITLG